MDLNRTSAETLAQNALEDRLQQLEINQVHQDSSIEALEKTISLQHQEIQLLNKKIGLLSDYIKTMGENSQIKRPDEEVPPPHY